MLFISTSMGFMHWIRFCCWKYQKGICKFSQIAAVVCEKKRINLQFCDNEGPLIIKNMKCIIIQNILTSNLQQAVFHRNIFTK